MIVKNPHIQIPCSILEKFSHKTDEGKKVYVLKINDRNIEEEKINKLGIGEEGYYPAELEEYFAKLESAFGNVRKEIDEFGKKKTKLDVTVRLQQLVLSFMDNMYERSDYFTKLYNDISNASKLFGEMDKSNLISLRKEMGATQLFTNFLRDSYTFNLLKNQTTKGFVIPRNCFYIYGRSFLMPISPRTAIYLMPNDEMSNYLSSDGELSYGFINNPLDISYLN